MCLFIYRILIAPLLLSVFDLICFRKRRNRYYFGSIGTAYYA